MVKQLLATLAQGELPTRENEVDFIRSRSIDWNRYPNNLKRLDILTNEAARKAGDLVYFLGRVEGNFDSYLTTWGRACQQLEEAVDWYEKLVNLKDKRIDLDDIRARIERPLLILERYHRTMGRPVHLEGMTFTLAYQ
jgi:hypothetical protein